MKGNVKKWYCQKYPMDELGESINEDVTFADVLLRIAQGESAYFVIGVWDSIVRERIFAEVAKRMDCDYRVIYNIWMHS